MRTLLALVFLFCAAPLFAANPSLFVPWTAILGSNGVSVVTNPASGRVIFSAPNANIWTNSAGVIQPVSTNQIQIMPSGALYIGNGIFSASDRLNITRQGNGDVPIDVNILSGDTNGSFSSYLQAQLAGSDSSPGARIGLAAFGTNVGSFVAIWADPGVEEIAIYDFDNNTLFGLRPSAANGTTPYTFDTSIEHNDIGAKLLSIENNNSAPVTFVGPSGAVVVSSDVDNWDEEMYGLGQTMSFLSLREVHTIDGARVLYGGINTNNNDQWTWDFEGRTNLLRLVAVVGQDTRLMMSPTFSGGPTAYVLDTSLNPGTGSLLETKNLGVTHFSVLFTNGLSTPLITAYGAVAQPWLLGSASNVVSVAFPGFTATNIIEVAINGVAYYIPAKIK